MNEARRRSQAGYTLVELLVATAIGTIVLGALTSIVVTTAISTNVATSRVDASSEIRNFQLAAYDDMTLSRPPVGSGCGTPDNVCTAQPMVLVGQRVPNADSGAPTGYSVTYTWDPASQVVTRQAGSASRSVTTGVTQYSWYVDSSTTHPAIVVMLTVTINTYNASYSDTQTLRFVPRITGS